MTDASSGLPVSVLVASLLSTLREQGIGNLAYSINDAARVVGYSDDVIRAALRRGDLRGRYGTRTKPVIEATELERWLASLPTEPLPKP